MSEPWPVSFRNAVENDIVQVMDIEAASSGRWDRSFFVHELGTSFSRFIVAEAGGTIAGYAVAWNVSGEIQLNNIAVREEFRRRGIGRSLLGHIIEILSPFKPEKILLEVNEKNAAARGFYRKMGFAETGVRKKYYLDDNAVLMEKNLRAPGEGA